MAADERMAGRREASAVRKQDAPPRRRAKAEEEARRALALLEAETAQAEEQLAALRRSIGARADRKPPRPPDAEGLHRVLAQLKARRAQLERLKGAVEDPSAALRAEDSLADLRQELAGLQKEQIAQARELRMVSRKVDELRAQYEGEQSVSQSAEQQEDEMESYIQRLKQLEKSDGERRAKSKEAKARCEEEWNQWFGMLCLAAKQLQAKVDAGDSRMAKWTERWDPATPAANVLETAHQLQSEYSSLKARHRDLEAKEAIHKEKLEKAQSRIDASILSNQKPPVGVSAISGARGRSKHVE
ncbi:hypothetical protein AB1Y20_002646 [Prymnesium parvum]|uniref:Centrosomal protein of 162 kDa n=1 Tax=Prymnesium parvum TaxID=97485 RepID=A0AB34JBS1_PRYPA